MSSHTIVHRMYLKKIYELFTFCFHELNCLIYLAQLYERTNCSIRKILKD